MEITIDPRTTYTKAAYLRAYPQDFKTLSKKIKSKEVKSIRVNGTTLILAEVR